MLSTMVICTKRNTPWFFNNKNFRVMKDNKVKEATGAQYAQFGLMVSQRTIKTLGEKPFGFNEMQELLRDPNKPIDSIVDKVVREIFKIKRDLWKREKEKISKFYSDCFGITVDWSLVTIPQAKGNLNHLELILADLTEDDIFKAYSKKFGEGNVWKNYNSITGAINPDDQQRRPDGNYPILHKGGAEPDKEHLNKSYDDFKNDGNKYMIVKEGMIAAFRYRYETGKMYDVKGVTRFHTLDSDGYVVHMCWDYDGGFGIDGDDRGYRYPDNGPRQVSF